MQSEVNKNKINNNINIIKIGNVKIERTAALAPMAGVSDRAFREVARSFGASYVVSEMISAKALCYQDKKTKKLLKFSEAERPIAFQIFGSEPECLAQASHLLLEYSPDIIDINMGCPVKKVVSNNSGSALMKDQKLVEKIVKSVRKAVKIPVTVKIRAGWDESNINAVEIAKIAEASGADAITVHARTKAQMYSPGVFLGVIEQVKNSVKIPVVGNGDVVDLSTCLNMYEKTGCDLVMIGRGALGNPWVFKSIKNYFESGETSTEQPDCRERIFVMKNHVKLMIEHFTEDVAIKEAKKHINWYLKGFKNAAIIRNKVSNITKFSELEDILDFYLVI